MSGFPITRDQGKCQSDAVATDAFTESVQFLVQVSGWRDANINDHILDICHVGCFE